jgi:hypothetical protein
MAPCKKYKMRWTFFASSGGNSLVKTGTQKPKPGLLPVLHGGF